MWFLKFDLKSLLIIISFFIFQSTIWIGYAYDLISLERPGVITLSIFITAIWFWIFSKIDDTYIALSAIVLLVLTGVIDDGILYKSLGQDLIWLLISAFILAAALTESGLTSKFAIKIIKFANTPRQLFYYSTVLLIISAFMIPSTSGRAALALPIFISLAYILRNSPRLIIGLSILFPSVILLSAIGSYLGAGAHLITNQILQQAHLDSFSFFEWFLYGFPFAVVSSLVCTELVLRLFTQHEDRTIKINNLTESLNHFAHNENESKKWTTKQRNCILIFIVVLMLWFTESWHGISAAMVALIGALLVSMPYLGCVKLSSAIKTIPWSLLIFMAATLCMGMALIETQAIEWLAHNLFSRLDADAEIIAVIFVLMIIVFSLFTHLLIQSRSARSVVIIPIVVASAPEFGVSPTAIAFISTAAAGFCHTLTSSAKPLAIFSKIEEKQLFKSSDLLRFSLWLLPFIFVLICIFGFFIWPLMGLTLFVN